MLTERLESRCLLAADPIISEFMASNDDTLLDGNGVSSDWIEIFNAGDQPIDLAGWSLSDDPASPAKWAFPSDPASQLGVGEYKVIFASGTGFPDPEGNLHTNFRLSAGGEYIGLANPSGQVVSEFGDGGSDYPAQVSDISYGRQVFSESGGPIKYVDASVAPGGNTTGLPGSWIIRGDVVGQPAYANGGSVLQSNGAVTELATTTGGLDAEKTYEVYAFFWDDTPGASWHIDAGLVSGQLEQYDIQSPDVFAVDASTQVSGLPTEVAGLSIGGDYSDYLDGNRRLYAARIGRVTDTETVTVYVDHDETRSERSWYDGIGIRQSDVLIEPDSPATYLIPGDDSLGTTWTQVGFDESAAGFTAGFASVGYENAPTSNNNYVGRFLTEIPSGTVSTYLRVPFEVEDASSVTELSLDLNFDDGFVLYLNGQPILARNEPATLNHQSAAATSNSDAAAVAGETFLLSGFSQWLQTGDNVLAAHVLNRPNSSDLLFSPRLRFRAGQIDLSEAVYFDAPTPGRVNGRGYDGFVGDTSFSVDRGFFTVPFDVAVTTNTPGATIYTTTDGSEPSPDNLNAIVYSAPITIDQTTNLRAAAFVDGYKPSNVDTQTYLFLDDVLTQDPLNDPADPNVYPTTWQGNATADYEIDPRVVATWDDNNPANQDHGIREALQSIPTISLTLPHEGLWNASSGIYPRSTSRGESWERAGSIEMIDPVTGDTFQENVGILMHGNASRDNARLLKHSFRLKFSPRFDGPGRLRYPLFDNTEFDDINQVILRASFTDAFGTRSVTNRYSPLDSTYLRDVWMRDTQLDAGGVAAASTYVHLYINGLYWGLYSPAERSADDQFYAAHLGGNAEDWDVMKDFDELGSGERTAWDAMFDLVRTTTAQNADEIFFAIQGKAIDGTDDPDLPNYLNMDSFIDYMVLHLYAGVEDWPSHNWHAGRNRVNPGKGFEFATWDQEIALDQLARNRTESSDSRRNPAEIYQRLRSSAEFRLRVADRIERLFAHDGALTVANNQARWAARVAQMDAAIIGESARWGDAREGQVITAYTSNGPFGVQPGSIPTGSQTVPLMTVDHWRSSTAYVHDTFFPQVESLFLGRMSEDDMVSTINAPDYSINDAAMHGGVVVKGSLLSIAGDGDIYVTTDGSDPRAPGGVPAGQLYSGEIVIDAQTTVRARSLVEGTWSAVAEATFEVIADDLVISELNYNPLAPSLAESTALPGINNEAFEFIELMNRADSGPPIVLDGATFTDGIEYTFPDGVQLLPGERLVVARNPAAFAQRYGNGITVLGPFLDGSLSNGGERLALATASGVTLLEMSYGDSAPWPIMADGDGGTLVLIDPSETPVQQLGKPYHWTANADFGGSPGTAGEQAQGIVINEVIAHTDLPTLDTVELRNASDAPIDISGWWLSDSGSDLLKFQIPTTPPLQPGQVIHFDESDFNPTPGAPAANHFSFNSAEGDEVYLVQAFAGNVTQVEDVVEFRATFNGQSLGRIPGQAGRLAPLANASLGEVNGAFAFSDVILSEVNYHPADPNPSALAIQPDLNDDDLEFIEVFNAGTEPVSLTDWRLRGVADFDFAAGTQLDSGATVIVVPFDPAADASVRDAFREHYGIDASVVMAGPFSGGLGNSHGVVQLLRPDQPPADQPLLTPRVLADDLYYDDQSPWPAMADGQGKSLQRIAASTLGSIAASWRGESPTPGSVPARPSVEEVIINGGDAGRSVVTEISVRFDRPVDLDGTAFEVSRRETETLVQSLLVSSELIDGKTVTTIRFGEDPLVDSRDSGHSLMDGNYELRIDGSKVFAANSDIAMGVDHGFGAGDVDGLFRYYGDVDGDRDVDGLDYVRFAESFLRTEGDAGFDAALDFDGDGDVDGLDYGRFAERFLRPLL